MDHQLISPAELNTALSNGEDITVLDVRSVDDFDRRRLPGARNNCVYEVAFLDRMPDLVADKEKKVCVYGHDAGTREARMAAEKLVRAGYRRVSELRDGVAGWESAGFAVEGTLEPAPARGPVLDGKRAVDLTESRVRWIGRNLLNNHWGTIGLKAGFLRFEAGKLSGGQFVLDMNTIECLDLRGDRLHDVLIDHLKSHDFFDTEIYPEARFQLLSAIPVADATAGSANLKIAGELTLKGNTRPIEFDAVSGFDSEGRFGTQAVLSFDRTLWNVLYGSGKFFRNLGGHLVNDAIEIQVRLVTR